MPSPRLPLALALLSACDDGGTAEKQPSAPAGESGGEGGDSSADTGPPPPPTDADGDGHVAIADGGDDCDDADPRTHPGAAELCDYADRDCDGDPDAPGACDEIPAIEDVAWATWLGNYDHTHAAELGYDVAVAGDLDGDGWAEPFVMCWGCDALDGIHANLGGVFVLDNPRGPLIGADYADHVRASWIGDSYFWEMGGIAGAVDLDADGWNDLAFTGEDYDAPGWLAVVYGPMDATWPVRGRIDETVDAWWTTYGAETQTFGGADRAGAIVGLDGGSTAVLATAWRYADEPSGRVFAFSGDLRGIGGEPVSSRLVLEDAVGSGARAPTSAGDFDGDGIADLAFARLTTDAEGLQRNTNAIVSGAGLLDAAGADVEDRVIASWDYVSAGGYGGCISSLGDLDGDGYDDVAFGDERVTERSEDWDAHHDEVVGIWYVLGRASGQRGETLAEDAVGVVQDTPGRDANGIGRCVGGGDLDADGAPDLVARGVRIEGYGVESDNPDSRDALWLLPGRDGVPIGTTEWTDRALGLASHTITEGDRSYLGFALSTGDLTGDGVDDLLVGDPVWSELKGGVFVIPGWPIAWDVVRPAR